MSKKSITKQNIPDEIIGSRFAIIDGEEYHGENNEGKAPGFFDRLHMNFQVYADKSKTMLFTSLQHFRAPSTIVVLIILTAVYILLTVARVGMVEFSFRGSKIIHYITTSMDIVVNAVLGFFYGPVVSSVSFLVCTLVRMIAESMSVYPGYIIAAIVAGFLHGWILYRHKALWFGTRFRGFHTDLLSKIFVLRLVVTVFVNIFLMSILHRIFIGYPIAEFILHYSKSKYELHSYTEVFSVFAVSLIFETAVIFVALSVINFIVLKAFPGQLNNPTLIIDENGALVNLEEEMMHNAPPEDMM